MHRNLSLCISACLRKVHAKEVCFWMCRCAYVYRDRGTLGLTEAAANVHTVLAKEVICFPGFVFLLPVGSRPSLKTKGA